jgi:hypothetical protein
LKDETAFYHFYIASRKELILSGSTADQWRHVLGRLNTTDDGTKGAKKFYGAHRWFKGPSFFKEDSRLWPDNKKYKAAAEELEEFHVIMNAVHLDPITEFIVTQLMKETREPQVGKRDEDPFKTALRKCVENVQVRNCHSTHG